VQVFVSDAHTSLLGHDVHTLPPEPQAALEKPGTHRSSRQQPLQFEGSHVRFPPPVDGDSGMTQRSAFEPWLQI
jgi:hypothetical protein